MRTILLILSLSAISSVQGQIESYKITKSDTIKLLDVSFKRVAAIHLSEATILVDYDLFMKHLTEERNGLKKQIRSRERMIKRGKDYPGITSSNSNRPKETSHLLILYSTLPSTTNWTHFM